MKYIALLRGINVSGHNLIKMTALKSLLEGIGLQQVQTYIQSGNVVFFSRVNNSRELEAMIVVGIQKEFQLEVPVLVLTEESLQQIIEENPFQHQPDFKVEKMYITYLSDKPQHGNEEKILSKKQESESLHFTDNAIYFYFESKYSDTKLTNTFLEKTLQVQATTRNWKTTLTLAEMMTRII